MAAAPAARPAPVLPARRGQYRLVAIGTSTGGPVALQQVLTKLPGNFPLPLLLIQHMPGSFTPAFAQRLNQQCAIEVREAQDGDEPKPGLALLAPGGKQMVLEQRAGRTLVRITESAPGQNYKPSVDVTFNSVARIFPGQVLAVVLTGMGADGREGARLLKQGGSNVWAQDEASCVVYGMPAAIVEAGLADAVLPLSEIGAALSQRV
jgi:two-component system chemotaxis response regulator CheB